MNATEAQDIHQSSIVIDGLFCNLHSAIPPTEDVPDMMFGHIVSSGVTAFCDSLIADYYPFSMEQAMTRLYEEHALIEAFPQKALIVRGVDDIRNAKASGRVGVILTTQGLACIGTDTRNLWILHQLGVRVMQITYNESCHIGCGCMEPVDTGLTRMGQKTIEEMNRLGVVVDLAHVGERTSGEAAKHSKQPVVVSHAAIRSLNQHPRNLSDDLIRLVADTNGVVGLCPHSVFIERERGKRPSINDFLDHIDYVVNLVGADHVAIGTDNFHYETYVAQAYRSIFERTFPGFFGGYGNEEKHVNGFSKWSDWPNLTSSLLQKGYPSESVRKILGGNFMRVFSEVWG